MDVDGCRQWSGVGAALRSVKALLENGAPLVLTPLQKKPCSRAVLVVGHGSAPGDHGDIAQLCGARLSLEPSSEAQLRDRPFPSPVERSGACPVRHRDMASLNTRGRPRFHQE